MKPFGTFLLFIAVMSCCCRQPDKHVVPQHFTVAADPASAGFDAQRLQHIDSLIAGYVRDGLAPNTLSFVARNGQIVHHKAYGYKDIEAGIPLKTDDIFRWASQTKAVATVALMTLFEENKFLLDDPVEKYLPMFASPQVFVSGSAEKGDIVTRPATRSITIRQLITHTSGYSYNTFGDSLNGFSYPYPITTKEIIERIARTPLMHDPGEKFTYGFGIDIVGHLAEVISGKRLDVLMKERIFEPLGMNDSYFYLPEEKHDRLVKLYRESGDKSFIFKPDVAEQIYAFDTKRLYHGGGGGLVGTIEDYAKFCQMVLNKGEFNGRRILGRKTIELMGRDNTINVIEKQPFEFGLGFEVGTFKNNYVKNMTSVGSLRWGGAFGTHYVIDPEENLIFLFFTNLLNWSHYTVAPEQFAIAVYQAMQ